MILGRSWAEKIRAAESRRKRRTETLKNVASASEKIESVDLKRKRFSLSVANGYGALDITEISWRNLGGIINGQNQFTARKEGENYGSG